MKKNDSNALDYGSFEDPKGKKVLSATELRNIKDKEILELRLEVKELKKQIPLGRKKSQVNNNGENNSSEPDTAGKISQPQVQSAVAPVYVQHSNAFSLSHSESSKTQKVKFSIGAKLITIISLVVVISLIGVTILVSYFVSADTRVNAEENNLTINTRTSGECESRISLVMSAVSYFSSSLENVDDLMQISEAGKSFFENYSEIGSVVYPEKNKVFCNDKFFALHDVSESNMLAYVSAFQKTIHQSKSGVVHLENASQVFGSPVIAIFHSVVNHNNEIEPVVTFFDSEKLNDSFSSGTVNSSYFLNQNGDVLVHSDYDYVMKGKNLSSDPVLAKIIENGSASAQFYALNQENKQVIVAWKKINSSENIVITTVELDIVLEGIRATTRRNIYLTVAILSVVIIIVWFFSRSLSVPLRLLADVANEINNANFNTELFDKLKVKSHDEVSVLVSSTKNERQILNTITKLTNIGVVRSVIRKEVDFDPHLKDITIFFSDIRGFTAISDGFNSRYGKESGAKIIGFLNDYMSRMVQCIAITGGVVDKFEGDAIMACWGVLRNDNLAFEDLPDDDVEKLAKKYEHDLHKKQDALSAIIAIVAMRYSLRKYNKDALLFTQENEGLPDSTYKPQIRIGCGLNSGRATVGFMGSWEKMEFTSIGDPVNLASRTESSNKPCGTDILITQDTYDLLKLDFIRCEENGFTISEDNLENEIIVEKIPVAFEVKGKGKQHFYGVVNMPNFDVNKFYRNADPSFIADEDCLDVVGPGGPKDLHELRKLLGIAEPDFGGVNLDESENKITVSAS